jgi:hypothetical protein
LVLVFPAAEQGENQGLKGKLAEPYHFPAALQQPLVFTYGAEQSRAEQQQEN